MTDPWFKPKSHGYGAQPANWKGWAVVGAYAVIFVYLLVRMVLGPLINGDPQLSDIFWFIAITLVMTGLLIWVAKVKCDGEWRWRWGQK